MKIAKLLMLSVTALALAACDFPGGGEVEGESNGELYTLTLTTNLDKAKSGIKAELGHERDEDEIADLKEAGASQEDIDKAGKLIDGKYYFFDQDGIYLYEPFLPGYEFLGWYNGNEWLGYMDPDYDGTPNYFWNIEGNTTLEARFKLMQFEILYMDEGLDDAEYQDNPKTWNIEQGEVVLNHKDKESDGLHFEGWSFAMGGDTHYDGYVTKLNEQFLIDSNVAKQSMEGRESMTFSLHENYSDIVHDVKLTFDPTVVEYVIVSYLEPGESAWQTIEVGGTHFLSSGEVNTQLKHNSEVKVYVRLIDPDNYAVSGIYYHSQNISQSLGNDEYKITASMDAEVQVCVEPF